MKEKNREYYIQNRDRLIEEKKRYNKEHYSDNRGKILAYNKQYYSDNRDRLIDNVRQYRKENPDKIIERTRRYREDNLHKIRERDRKYRLDNPDKIREYFRKYNLDNPDIIRGCRHRRRARLSRAEWSKYIPSEILDRDYWTCYLCGKTVVKGEDTLDHIIPIVKKGADCAENIACAHRSCNSRKGTRLPHEHLGDAWLERIPEACREYVLSWYAQNAYTDTGNRSLSLATSVSGVSDSAPEPNRELVQYSMDSLFLSS